MKEYNYKIIWCILGLEESPLFNDYYKAEAYLTTLNNPKLDIGIAEVSWEEI